MPHGTMLALAMLAWHCTCFAQWSAGGGALVHAERRERKVYFGPVACAELRINERWSTRASGFWAIPKKHDVDWTSGVNGNLPSGIPPNTRYDYANTSALSALDLSCAMRLGKVKRTKRKGHAIIGMGVSVLRVHSRSRGQRTDLITGSTTPIAHERTQWLSGLFILSGYERETRLGALFIESRALLVAERHERWLSHAALQLQAGYRFRLGKP